MSILNRTIKPGISLTSKGHYRCRIMRNGKKYETYTTSLKKATTWLKAIRLGQNPTS